MFLKPGQVVERYTVEADVGEGGVATVYRVRHNTLGTIHALKILHVNGTAIRDRLVQEGRVQAALRHPNIVAVTDVIDVDGSPGLLMEFIEGRALDRWLREHRPSLAQAEEIFRGILAGVARAHRVGLIHRDLKPGNVLLEVGEDGAIVPKVSDFGLAKILAEDEGTGRAQTRSGMTMGTPAYMAPEQVRDAKTVDQRADIFALGCILYELCVGASPFDQGDVLAIFSALAAGSYTPPEQLNPDIPVRLRNAIVGCLSNRREDRIPDCATLRQVLDGTLADAWPTLAPTSVEELRQRSALASPPSPRGSLGGGPSSSPTFALVDAVDAGAGRTVVPESAAPVGMPDPARSLPPPPSLPPGRTNATVTAADLSILPADEVQAARPTAAPKGLLATLLGLGVAGFTTVAVIVMVLGGFAWAIFGPAPENDGERFVTPGPIGAPPEPLRPGSAEPVVPVAPTLPPTPTPPPADPPPTAPTTAAPTPATPAAPASGAAVAAAPPATGRPVTKPPPDPPSTPAPAAATGTVSVTGDADEVWLEGPAGRVGLGSVPAGEYKIKARFRGEAAISAGKVSVRAGQAVSLGCSADFQLCKVK